MDIEIWSDIRCPFCYIGKRKFEIALAQFENKDSVHVRWRSFQLDPALKTDTTIKVVDHLSVVKRISRQTAEDMHYHVTNMAREVGLIFNFDKGVVANSFNAHRLIQYSLAKGKGDLMEELLFRSYFSDGKNIDDLETLTDLAKEAGLNYNEVQAILTRKDFEKEVNADQLLAQQLGIRGVPFFLIEGKYGISGAQPSEFFLEALKKVWSEMQHTQQSNGLHDGAGASCSLDTPNC